MIFLSKDNLDILIDELAQNFNMTIDNLNNKDKSKRKSYEVRVVPPLKYITVKNIKHKYHLTDKEYDKPVDFGLSDLDCTKYEALVYEKRGLEDNTSLKTTNVDNLREMRRFSKLMLVVEIAKYFNKQCSLISKILDECIDGIDEILSKVNLYNDIIYDVIIPTIFNALY